MLEKFLSHVDAKKRVTPHPCLWTQNKAHESSLLSAGLQPACVSAGQWCRHRVARPSSTRPSPLLVSHHAMKTDALTRWDGRRELLRTYCGHIAIVKYPRSRDRTCTALPCSNQPASSPSLFTRVFSAYATGLLYVQSSRVALVLHGWEAPRPTGAK